MKKMRLDTLLANRGLVVSRNKAQGLIMAGKVRVDGQVVTKAGTEIPLEATIDLEPELPYVGRGALKLVAALESFAINPIGTVCADVGASTGGFTDVLLQHEAARVYAIDVGYGQLAWKLRQDQRVIVMERTNARHLISLPEAINLVTIDVSFISLKIILPAVQKWLTTPATVIALVKPQFEAGRDQVGKGGVVRDREVHRQVLHTVIEYGIEQGFAFLDVIPSPITGPAGNHEFLLQLDWQPSTASAPSIAQKINDCLALLG